MQGEAECRGCNRTSTFELTGEWEDAGEGCRWYVAVDGQYCVCGEPWRWMHWSPPELLDLCIVLELRENAQ